MVHPSLPRIGNWADDGRWGNVNLSRLGIPEAIGQSGSISGRHDDEGDNPDKGGGDFDDYDGPTLTPGDDENPLHHDRSFSQPLLPDTDWEDLVDNPVGKKARFNNKENNEPEGVYKHKLNTFNREVREETGEKCSPGITAPKRKADSFKDDSAQAIKKASGNSRAQIRHPQQNPQHLGEKSCTVLSPTATKKSEFKPVSRQISRKPITSEAAHDDLPSICPENHCKDSLPSQPSQALVLLFAEHRDLLTENGKNTASYREVTNRICKYIKHENLSALSHLRGWPTSVDFDFIPECVLAMENNILELVLVPRRRARSNLKTSRIAESVENILSRNTGADQIFWTVASLVDTPRQWDDTDDDSALIPEADFIDHILLPYLTLCLISDDLQIDFLRAIKVLEESDAFGKGFNPVTRLQTARNTWCSPHAHPEYSIALPSCSRDFEDTSGRGTLKLASIRRAECCYLYVVNHYALFSCLRNHQEVRGAVQTHSPRSKVNPRWIKASAQRLIADDASRRSLPRPRPHPACSADRASAPLNKTIQVPSTHTLAPKDWSHRIDRDVLNSRTVGGGGGLCKRKR
ncbi:hypothetical protein B0H13DRAFT_2332135 [Mycena leptocephala]|nr:hypothetical protein B0H13DRAFT_2332135 [Mycena leptocephala]